MVYKTRCTYEVTVGTVHFSQLLPGEAIETIEDPMTSVGEAELLSSQTTGVLTRHNNCGYPGCNREATCTPVLTSTHRIKEGSDKSSALITHLSHTVVFGACSSHRQHHCDAFEYSKKQLQRIPELRIASRCQKCQQHAPNRSRCHRQGCRAIYCSRECHVADAGPHLWAECRGGDQLQAHNTIFWRIVRSSALTTAYLHFMSQTNAAFTTLGVVGFGVVAYEGWQIVKRFGLSNFLFYSLFVGNTLTIATSGALGTASFARLCLWPICTNTRTILP